MRYQKIWSQVWHDEKFIALNDDSKLLFFYLLTSPHNNSVGLYILPKQYALADLNWSSQRFKKPFHILLDEGFILYDEAARLLCIKNQLKHNPLENEKQAIGAAKVVAALPKSSLYSDILEQLTKPYHKPLIIQLKERYGKPEEREREEERTKIKQTAAFILPNWVPEEEWQGYLDMRKLIRAPMTDRAKNIAIGKLKGFKEDGLDLKAIIDRSTEANWKSFYLPDKPLNKQETFEESVKREAALLD